jgi:acyl-CoA synthetase (AMP-forming)/AMP-acid ligase II
VTATALWPTYDHPDDLPAIEAVPLDSRGLPTSTYHLLVRAADLWPDRTALTVLPDAARWREPVRRTYSQLIADVHRAANALHAAGIRRNDAVALMSPNCDELVTATLAAQVAGIAAPINPGLSGEHIAELLRRSGARIFAALPLFHVNALIVTLLAPMLRGQNVVWAGPLGYRVAAPYGEFWRIVEHYRLAAMSAVHTVYAVLAQCPVDADISSLRACLVGASMLPAAAPKSVTVLGAIVEDGSVVVTVAAAAGAAVGPALDRYPLIWRLETTA